MASLPYVSSPGNIAKALQGIKAAAVPERVSQDFVKTILKIPGGSGDQMTAFLKKLGFSGADSTPTEIYTKFRNPTTSGLAMARAIKQAYAPLYVRNEYTHGLSEEDLVGLIMEETGASHDSNAVKLTASCIKSLKGFADFSSLDGGVIVSVPEKGESGPEKARPEPSQGQFGLNLGYTININLPATSDQSVFNAIFKSIKENLLRSDDA